MRRAKAEADNEQIAKYADMFAAMGTEARLVKFKAN
jgi:hypothetical protein